MVPGKTHKIRIIVLRRSIARRNRHQGGQHAYVKAKNSSTNDAVPHLVFGHCGKNKEKREAAYIRRGEEEHTIRVLMRQGIEMAHTTARPTTSTSCVHDIYGQERATSRSPVLRYCGACPEHKPYSK